MITALDHLPVVVEALEPAVEGFTALLGRGPVWRGRYPGARHAWFQLPDIALDVIAPHGEGAAGNETRARLAKHGPGVSAVGWRVARLDEAVSRLERRGLSAAGSGVTRSEGDGGETHEWTLAMLRARPTGGCPCSWCRPRRRRRRRATPTRCWASTIWWWRRAGPSAP